MKIGRKPQRRKLVKPSSRLQTKPLNNKLFVIPLGGCGEIGRNMTVFEFNKDIIVVDAGVMFPEDEMLGVDVIIPDFSYLLKRKTKIRGIILTHGHEDHIGALPYLLPRINVPMYGTRLTLGLCRSKLDEFNLSQQSDFRPIRPGDELELGCFKIEFFRVSHSIVDGVGLAIHTPVGTVVHTGDFKIDQTPIDGETTDFHKIAELGNKGVSLLMSDSTNVERPGYSLSEREIGEILREIFEASQDRIIVATFASNIHRIKQVAECTVQTGRKICLIGLSIVNTVKMARELKYLDFPDDLFVSPKDLETLPHKRTVILTTGSQGEPMSALSRMATDSHRFIRIKKGDTVVISARMIPGNEITISRTINSLFERGAEVIYEKVSDVHVSGHASQEELKLMLNLVRPKYFMPIHGEYRHLVHHGQIAERIGMAKDRVLILKNGTKVVLDKEGARISGKVRAGTILVDGKGVGDVGSVVLRDRQHLSQDGMVIVVITLNKQTGELLAGPDLVTRGFVYAPRADDLILKAKEKVFGVLKQAIDSKSANWSNLKSSVRQTLRKFLYEQTERRPMILPIIMEV